MKNLFLFILIFMLPSICVAQESIGDSIDCTDVSVDYLDNPNLTREEKLTLMDRAFFESLNKFELCQAAREMASSSSSASSGGGGAGGTSGQAGGGSGGVQGTEGAEGPEGSGGGADGSMTESMSGGEQSVASSSMSGTEAPPLDIPPAEGGMQGSEAGGTEQGGEMNSQGGGVNTDSGGAPMTAAKNSQTPEDIPSAANDDALAAQIRYAAENEPDPQKKAQLWNEYRKYKGLPQK